MTTIDIHPYASASTSSFCSSSNSLMRRPRGSTHPGSSNDATLYSNLNHTLSFADDRRPSEPDSLFLDMSDSREDDYDYDKDEEARRKEKEKEEKRERRRGVANHGVGIEAMLRVAEKCGRPAPRSYSPEVVHNDPLGSIEGDSASISLTIEELTPCFPHPPFSTFSFNTTDESDKGSFDISKFTKQHSPTSSVSSYSPSTPVLPLTPVLSNDELSLPSVAPLVVSKSQSASSNTTHKEAVSPTSTTTPQRVLHGSRNRFSARTASLASVARVFAPLDTVAAQNLDLSLGIAEGDLTLTGILEEVRREAERNRAERENEEFHDDDEDDDDLYVDDDEEEEDGEWINFNHEVDDEAARDFYRADIATHLQLFTMSPPFSRSYGITSQDALPPARPDSFFPSPYFKLPTNEVPPIPLSTPENLLNVSNNRSYSGLRRASASSLASNSSGRSIRSNRSSSSKGKNLKKRRSRARLSAAAAVKKRPTRPLPPLPAEETSNTPCPALDPTFSSASSVSSKPTLSIKLDPSPRRSPRSSLPVDIEDVFGDRVAVEASKTKEDDDEEKSSICSTIKERDVQEIEVRDPYSLHSSAHQDVPQTPAPYTPLSPSFSSPMFTPGPTDIPAPMATPPFLLTPSTATTEDYGETDTFDAESLYSPKYRGRCDSIARTETDSLYHDGNGRVLRSRWSVSTFASSAPSHTSSSGSVSSKLASLIPQSAQRWQAKIRGARERASQQSRDARAKAKAQREEMVTVGTPFFPRPRAPSPKRKNNPGPGKYVPKPELMPPSQRQSTSASAETSAVAATPRSSCETHSSASSSSGVVVVEVHPSTSSRVPMTPAATATAKATATSSPSHKEITAQFAQYREHRYSPEHAAHDPSDNGNVNGALSARESLSAFPFKIVGCEDDWESVSASAAAGVCTGVCEEESPRRKSSESVSSFGLRRKPIPFFGRS
ncbi:hypothetical protein PNOK_0306400 [Pyrrhoderma noxium]|uniref:Uncharacterized protein n=1 Tax=Pyrrhoderma noxium TaxID=2282107 RepID=A0A286ULE5_9AGAM|nr:hypothetical protein PNOK_0306400 [Pyrrhoderma noxium]